MTYSEKLRDPQWQKKRLKILERDSFTCQFCEDTKSPLDVHHKFYLGFHRDPWDYPDSFLITLCSKCHKKCTTEPEEMQRTSIWECIAAEALNYGPELFEDLFYEMAQARLRGHQKKDIILFLANAAKGM